MKIPRNMKGLRLPSLATVPKKVVQIDDETQIIQPYTKDRYGLYLRGYIGDLEPTNRSHTIGDYDEWIQLWGCINVKSVALAQKGFDLQLTVAQYWTCVFAHLFFGSLLIVSLPPSQKCYPWFRGMSYIIGSVFYGIIIFWILMNTRTEQMHKPWVLLLRIPYAAVNVVNLWLVLVNCKNSQNNLITFILLFCFFLFYVYILLFLSRDLSFKERCFESFQITFSGVNALAILVFGVKQVMRTHLTMGIIVIVCGVIDFLVLALGLSLNQKVGVLTVMVVNIVSEMVLVGMVLVDIAIAIKKHAGHLDILGLGTVVVFLGTANTLVLINRVCKRSTDTLRDLLNRNQSLDSNN